jgi:hypothetical protein
MKTSLKTFLTDLYEIDPTLKVYEAEIIPLVEKLMQSDPAVEPDTEFVQRLRMQLQNRATELSSPSSAVFSRWLYAFGGAITAAIIIPVAFVAIHNMKPTTTLQQDDAALFGYSITEQDKDAFGSLSGMSNPATLGRNQGGGGGGNAVNAVPAMATTNEMAVDTDAKMIAPYPMIHYEYVFSGTLPEFSPTVSVFRRNPLSTSIPFSAIGSSLNLGNIDLTSFTGMNMDSVTFSQNKSYGYQMMVNLRDTSVSLDAQWEHWPQSKCQTDACYQAERVKLSEVPSEDELIAAANVFIKDHSIDTSHYGTPMVDMTWKRDYDRTPNKNDAWIPDQMRVMYPLVIENQRVTDQSGMPFGISVGVHVKTRKVMNVYGLMSRDYDKSEYAGVTDSKEIMNYLSKIDNYNWMPEAERKNMNTATVTLGEPVMGYSVYYKYTNAINDELLIPSLTFPITDVQGGDQYFYRQSIVVPLAADMLKEQVDGGRPMPMDSVREM